MSLGSVPARNGSGDSRADDDDLSETSSDEGSRSTWSDDDTSEDEWIAATPKELKEHGAQAMLGEDGCGFLYEDETSRYELEVHAMGCDILSRIKLPLTAEEEPTLGTKPRSASEDVDDFCINLERELRSIFEANSDDLETFVHSIPENRVKVGITLPEMVDVLTPVLISYASNARVDATNKYLKDAFQHILEKQKWRFILERCVWSKRADRLNEQVEFLNLISEASTKISEGHNALSGFRNLSIFLQVLYSVGVVGDDPIESWYSASRMKWNEKQLKECDGSTLPAFIAHLQKETDDEEDEEDED